MTVQEMIDWLSLNANPNWEVRVWNYEELREEIPEFEFDNESEMVLIQ